MDVELSTPGHFSFCLTMYFVRCVDTLASLEFRVIRIAYHEHGNEKVHVAGKCQRDPNSSLMRARPISNKSCGTCSSFSLVLSSFVSEIERQSMSSSAALSP